MRRLSLVIGGILLAGCDVTAPAPVTVTFCDNQVVGGRIAIRDDNPVFGLAKPWTIVESPDGKTFSFTPPARLSMAFTEFETEAESDLRVFQLVADELPKLSCLPSAVAEARTYTGTLSGIGAGMSAQLWLGSARTTRTNGAFTLQNFLAGASDLVAVMRAGSTVSKFIVRRGIDLPNGTVLDVLDFAGTEAEAPRLNTAVISGANGNPLTTLYRVVTQGTNAGLPAVVSNGAIALAALPSSRQAANDFYVLGIAMTNGGLNPEGRSVSMQFSTPADRALVFGPPLEVPTTSYSATTGPASLRLTLPVQSEYAGRADITISESNEGMFRAVSMTMTRAYRAGAPSWIFVTPDPSALDMRGAQLTPTAPATWIAYAASDDFARLFAGAEPVEFTVREAYRDGGVEGGARVTGSLVGGFTERQSRAAPLSSPFRDRD